MKTFSNIVLGIGLFLMTFLVSSLIEYFIPGSTSWIMNEVDRWYAMTIGWTVFIVLVSVSVVIVWFLVIKLGPPLLDLARQHLPEIMASLGTVSQNPKVRTAIIWAVCALALLLVLGVVGMGIWFLFLIL